MNNIECFSLKVLRRIYLSLNKEKITKVFCESDPDTVSQLIYKMLMSDKPCMIARFGSTELSALVNYLGVNSSTHSYLKYIQGKQPEWWWNKNIMNQMQQWSGFFPPTPENMQKFGDLMIKDIPMVDILGSWLTQENFFKNQLQHVHFVRLELLNPYWCTNPWSKALEGKKVLVIHPFIETIKKQYARRELLFKNPDVLPEFELKTIKAVQSLGGNNQFKTWFDALQWMKDEMDKIDYDICLIGCGAYGFPLAAHAKRQGKKAVHLGGSLQLLFAIRGARWENPNYNKTYNYAALMNEYWVKPSENEKPQNAQQVEGACYW